MEFKPLTEEELEIINDFVSSPEKYASQSDGKETLEYLEKEIRGRLSHEDLVIYYEAKRKYQIAVQNYGINNIPDCPRCQRKMVLRNGKYGKFWGCSQFPRCKGTRRF